MPNIPSAGTRNFLGVVTAFNMSGPSTSGFDGTYAAISNLTIKWGNSVNEEHVVGTDIPYLGTAGFHGDFEFQSIASSDSRLHRTVSVTSGQLSAFGVTWKEDDSTSAITWTFSGLFTEYEKRVEKDGFVMYRLRGLMGARPTATGL